MLTKMEKKFTRSCKKFKSVDIYILTDPKDHNDDPIDSQHTLWIRKLKMKVKLDTFVKRKNKPYVALIVINNKDGNEYMASIENHQHNGLDPTRLSGKKQKIAQESIKKVQEELDKILEDLRDKGSKQQLLSETDWWIVNLPGDPTSGSEETNPLEIDYISKSTDVFEEIIEKRQDPFQVLIRDIDGEIFEPGPKPEPSPNPNPSPTPKPRHRYKAIRGPIDRMRINHINENKYEVIVITNEDLPQARFVCYGSSDNKEKERRVNILKAYNDNENFRVTTNTFLAKNLIRGKNKFFIEIDQNIKISPRLWMLKDNEKGNNNE